MGGCGGGGGSNNGDSAAAVAAVQRRRWRQFCGGDGDVVTVFLSRGKIPRRWKNSTSNKTVRIETYTSIFGGKVLTDEKSLDIFNVPKLHPTHLETSSPHLSVPS